MRRMPAIVALLGLVAVGCGADDATDAGPVPGRPAGQETTADSAVTTTTAPSAAASGAASSAPSAPTTTDVKVWLVRGETLEAVTRTVPRVPGVGAEAVKALLAGPTPAELRSGFGTAVPSDTRFIGLAIDGSGVARVDLTRDFESGGGSLGLTLRLGQVTCTLGQFPTIKGVRFALAGELVSVFSGNGIVIDKPVTCDSYRQVARPQADDPASLVGIWPLATRADVAAYEGGSDRTYTDPVATARAFATRYLGMDDPVDFGFKAGAGSDGQVPMGPRFGEGRTPLRNSQPTFTVVLRHLGGAGTTGYYTVTEVTSPTIVVTSPTPADNRIGSPVRVTGRAHAFEGTVNVEVREDGMLAGQALGRGVVTGGGDALRPFSGEITFRAPSKRAGAMVFTELGMADGQGILRAAVVRVLF